jgi:pyridinium-3,5-bisthiocarboxylic acid mononucleotide nickel chelatase
MVKIAYFDCFSGISGDMVLGALLDLGVPAGSLLDELKKLSLQGYGVHVCREMRGAISGTRVKIEVHHQPSRNYEDIRELILSSGLDLEVKERSLAIFERLATAESRVHGIPMSHVHFHEVGAVDSILDVVGAVVGLRHLGIEKVFASRIPLGHGFVKTHHGVIPVPAPATVLLLEGVPVYDGGSERELVTPTGAAILATLAESFGPVPDMVLASTGYGVGSHPASDPPNLLRILCGTSRASLTRTNLLVVETNIDDMNPEFYDYVMQKLFALGVLDVGISPVQMKKNRPGALIRVLLEPAIESRVIELLFEETTTLGVRVHEVKRVELQRRIKEIETPYGTCRVKCVLMPDGAERMIPEYEDCRRLAEERNIPLRRVYEDVAMLANQRS